MLDLYAELPDQKRPVVCFDESPIQLIGATVLLKLMNERKACSHRQFPPWSIGELEAWGASTAASTIKSLPCCGLRCAAGHLNFAWFESDNYCGSGDCEGPHVGSHFENL